jgi:hypothetical protein
MKRSGIILTALFIATTPALGRPVAIPKPNPEGRTLLDLSSIHLHLFHLNSDADAVGSTPSGSTGSNWSSQSLSLPNLSLGALHAQFGADDNPREGLSSYKMLGADQLGSSVWHAQEGRAAKLLFVWPTDK